jgi:alpha-1,3-rhamnosyl/mannosyltransferase
VPSEAVRVELVAHFSTPTDKIVVAPPGVDRRIFRPVSPAEGAAVRSRLGMPDHYFLFVGTLQPRKNILGLLAAYCALPSDVKSREALVLVGMKGWRDDGIVAELDRLRAAGEHVHPVGYVATTDLPALYSGSTAFVWPSLYEGFGMPILEAMACGAPVITSDRSSMPEAAGGAALLVDPTDVDSLSAAMLRIAEDDELARDLARRGHERAARADWHHTAARVLHALEMAADTATSAQASAQSEGDGRRRPQRHDRPVI